MSITKRMQRLFQADVHGILDAMEEPVAVLKQAIREMEDILDQKRIQLRKEEKEIQFLKATKEELQNFLEKTRQDISISLKNDNADLAKTAIAKKLGLEREIDQVAKKVKAIEESVEYRSKELKDQEEQFASLVEKSKLLTDIQDEDSPFDLAESILSSTHAPGSNFARGISREDVEMEFLRLQERQSKGGKK